MKNLIKCQIVVSSSPICHQWNIFFSVFFFLRIYIYKLSNPKGSQREALKVFPLPAMALCLRYTREKLFAALDSGSVLVFERRQGNFLIY